MAWRDRSAPRVLPGEPIPGASERENQMVQEMWEQVLERMPDGEDYDILVQPNLSHDARDAAEPNLYVLRPPAEIRPQRDTGIVYSVQDEQFRVDLNDSAQGPQYEWNQLALRTPHKLCIACLDVLNYICKSIEAEQARKARDKEMVMYWLHSHDSLHT